MNRVTKLAHFISDFQSSLGIQHNPSVGHHAIDFSNVDVGNLSSEAMANIDEAELDQYLPHCMPPSSSPYSPYAQSSSTTTMTTLEANASSVNAIYDWSNRYLSSLQNRSVNKAAHDAYLVAESIQKNIGTEKASPVVYPRGLSPNPYPACAWPNQYGGDVWPY